MVPAQSPKAPSKGEKCKPCLGCDRLLSYIESQTHICLANTAQFTLPEQQLFFHTKVAKLSKPIVHTPRPQASQLRRVEKRQNKSDHSIIQESGDHSIAQNELLLQNGSISHNKITYWIFMTSHILSHYYTGSGDSWHWGPVPRKSELVTFIIRSVLCSSIYLYDMKQWLKHYSLSC